jgi:hypothetical protein
MVIYRTLPVTVFCLLRLLVTTCTCTWKVFPVKMHALARLHLHKYHRSYDTLSAVLLNNTTFTYRVCVPI